MSATLSSCGRYRYLLTRELDTGDGTVCFVMLNPSTADAAVDDPTIRRCLGFTRRLGYARMVVVNLFAWRATDPADLWSAPDAVGPRNDQEVLAAALDAELVVAAWGALDKAWEQRARDVRLLLARSGREHLACLGLTKSGHPRHPLYLRADAEVIAIPPLGT